MRVLYSCLPGPLRRLGLRSRSYFGEGGSFSEASRQAKPLRIGQARLPDGQALYGGQALHGGQAMLTAVLFFLFAGMALLLTFSSLALRETRASRIDLRAKQSYFLAEAGGEDVAWRIRENKQYAASQTVTLGNVSAAVSATDVGNTKVVRGVGDISSAIRQTEIVLRKGASVSFNFAMYAGPGGLDMENSSKIIGDVYSNGYVQGHDSAEITGDALVAGTNTLEGASSNLFKIGGTAHAGSIRWLNVTGAAKATTLLRDSIVGGDAHGDTVTGNTVSGALQYRTSQTGNTAGSITQVSTVPANLPPAAFPVSDAQIAGWEDDADDYTYTGPCTIQDGFREMRGKVNCNLTIKNDAEVKITGPVWIAGKLDMENQAKLTLADTYPADALVPVIVDNPLDRINSSRITLGSNVQIAADGPYIMLISMNNAAENGQGTNAIAPQNQAAGAIYYAPHGKILVQNNIAVKEIAAYQINMQNSALLTFDAGLTDTIYVDDPDAGWVVRSWHEVR